MSEEKKLEHTSNPVVFTCKTCGYEITWHNYDLVAEKICPRCGSEKTTVRAAIPGIDYLVLTEDLLSGYSSAELAPLSQSARS